MSGDLPGLTTIGGVQFLANKPLSAYSAEELRSMRKKVCAHALDCDDARMLLTVLGLLEEVPDAGSDR